MSYELNIPIGLEYLVSLRCVGWRIFCEVINGAILCLLGCYPWFAINVPSLGVFFALLILSVVYFVAQWNMISQIREEDMGSSRSPKHRRTVSSLADDYSDNDCSDNVPEPPPKVRIVTVRGREYHLPARGIASKHSTIKRPTSFLGKRFLSCVNPIRGNSFAITSVLASVFRVLFLIWISLVLCEVIYIPNSYGVYVPCITALIATIEIISYLRQPNLSPESKDNFLMRETETLSCELLVFLSYAQVQYMIDCIAVILFIILLEIASFIHLREFASIKFLTLHLSLIVPLNLFVHLVAFCVWYAKAKKAIFGNLFYVFLVGIVLELLLSIYLANALVQSTIFGTTINYNFHSLSVDSNPILFAGIPLCLTALTRILWHFNYYRELDYETDKAVISKSKKLFPIQIGL